MEESILNVNLLNGFATPYLNPRSGRGVVTNTFANNIAQYLSAESSLELGCTYIAAAWGSMLGNYINAATHASI